MYLFDIRWKHQIITKRTGGNCNVFYPFFFHQNTRLAFLILLGMLRGSGGEAPQKKIEILSYDVRILTQQWHQLKLPNRGCTFFWNWSWPNTESHGRIQKENYVKFNFSKILSPMWNRSIFAARATACMYFLCMPMYSVEDEDGFWLLDHICNSKNH